MAVGGEIHVSISGQGQSLHTFLHINERMTERHNLLSFIGDIGDGIDKRNTILHNKGEMSRKIEGNKGMLTWYSLIYA